MIYLVSREQFLFEPGDIKCVSVEESLELLAPLKIVGLDTETTGLDPYTKELKLVQMGCKNFQVVIDTSTISILEYKEYLESDRLFLLWNAKFDLKWFYKYSIVINNVYDGYLAEKLMWLGYPAGLHSMSLKSAGENYLGIELDKSVRGKIIYSKLDEEIIRYGAADVEWLETIREKQLELLKEKDLITACDIENRFVKVLAYIEWCGVKLDEKKWKEKMEKDNQRLIETKNKLDNWLRENMPNSKYISTQLSLFDDPETFVPEVLVNWRSAKQVIPIFKKFGVSVEVEDKDKGGEKDSIDVKVLKPQIGVCSLVPLYIEYKKAEKVTSTYGKNFLEQINPVSGRLHTNYSQLGADTTRITSGGTDKENNIKYINFLNLPSDPETRACFVAEPGNKWISIDYSGQETYIMASLANDAAIIKELTYGSGDIHSLTAYMSYMEIPRDTPIKDIKEKFHKLRQEAKGIEFAINYGGNADTIYKNKGIPKQEAEKIYNNYMNGFSGLKRYQDFRRRDWVDKGYILLNGLTKHKAFIYDYNDLMDLKKEFTPEFWDAYRAIPKDAQGKKLPRNGNDLYMIEQVRKYFKRKADSDRQSINYPIQATGSMCIRVALINLFSYICKNGLFGKVKIMITPYDEINCEAPEDIAEDVAKEVYNDMVNSGRIFCTRCKLDADTSRLPDGTLPKYWIH